MSDDRDGRPGLRGRLVRWRAVVGLAVHRLRDRGSSASTRQVWLSVAGVAVAVALVVLVAGTSLSLATETTVRSQDVDYWVVPGTGSATTPVVPVRGPQLGGVHEASARVRELGGVAYATPVQLALVRMRADGDDDAEYVLAIGVVPGTRLGGIAGLSTDALRSGDPHYANGTYDGPWTGGVVLSAAAAERLGGRSGATLHVNTTRDSNSRRGGGEQTETRNATATAPAAMDFEVAAVAVPEGDAGPVAQLPIAVVHLSELQAVTGAASGDRADRLLVRTTAPGLRPDLTAAFPEATVVASQSLAVRRVLDSDLPLAMALAATSVALLVGTLFVATTLGLDSVGDHRRRAVLTAIGLSHGTRRLLVAAQALAIALAGGLVGVALGLLAIWTANAAAAEYVAVSPVATVHPLLVPLGLGVALGIGLLVLPYLFWFERYVDPLEAMRR